MKIEIKLFEFKILIDNLIDLNYFINDVVDIILLNDVNVKGIIYCKYDEVIFNLIVIFDVV